MERPLISRSMSKIASIRLTASTASGASTESAPRALAADVGSSKNVRRPCAATRLRDRSRFAVGS